MLAILWRCHTDGAHTLYRATNQLLFLQKGSDMKTFKKKEGAKHRKDKGDRCLGMLDVLTIRVATTTTTLTTSQLKV